MTAGQQWIYSSGDACLQGGRIMVCQVASDEVERGMRGVLMCCLGPTLLLLLLPCPV
jgi:hypothetical protein